jgi:DNA-binding response OmpR family regulator
VSEMGDKILVIEDDATLREALAYNLNRQGYEAETAANGITGLELARQINPDLVLLDIMLPGMDGFDVCRIIRQELSTPIIILTARDDEIDRVLGLEMGADDYLTKPFSMRELMARVKANLRRVRLDQVEAELQADTKSKVVIFGNLEIDFPRREVRLNGQPVPLKPKEYELLVFLVKSKGHMLSRDLILERVWGWEFRGGSRTVDVHIRWLREKIEPDPSEPSRIITVRGAGYRFEG